jgi:hypothetical protein
LFGDGESRDLLTQPTDRVVKAAGGCSFGDRADVTRATSIGPPSPR